MTNITVDNARFRIGYLDHWSCRYDEPDDANEQREKVQKFITDNYRWVFEDSIADGAGLMRRFGQWLQDQYGRRGCVDTVNDDLIVAVNKILAAKEVSLVVARDDDDDDDLPLKASGCQAVRPDGWSNSHILPIYYKMEGGQRGSREDVTVKPPVKRVKLYLFVSWDCAIIQSDDTEIEAAAG